MEQCCHADALFAMKQKEKDYEDSDDEREKITGLFGNCDKTGESFYELLKSLFVHSCEVGVDTVAGDPEKKKEHRLSPISQQSPSLLEYTNTWVTAATALLNWACWTWSVCYMCARTSIHSWHPHPKYEGPVTGCSRSISSKLLKDSWSDCQLIDYVVYT